MFVLALLVGGFGGGGTLRQSVVYSLVRPVVVPHEAKRIGFVELVDLVQVAARRIPNRLLRLDLEVIHLLCRRRRGAVSRVVCRRLIGRSRATVEGRVFVTAAAVAVRGR